MFNIDAYKNIEILRELIDMKIGFTELEKNMYEELILFYEEERMLDYKIIKEILEMISELFLKLKYANESFFLFHQLKDLRKSQEVVFSEYFFNNHLNELSNTLKEHIENLTNYGYDAINLELRHLMAEYTNVYINLAQNLSEAISE